MKYLLVYKELLSILYNESTISIFIIELIKILKRL